ncbi:hypothetical protein LINPERHAP1_LOCUS2366 [Linum perenne]
MPSNSGARFEFALDEDLIEAARCEEVKNALAAKGSKERIGSEIDLMIRGIEPVKAMSYISDLTLYFVVFCLPPNVQPDVSVGCQRTYPVESFSSLKEYHPNFNHDSLLASNSFSSAYSGDDAESTSSTKGLEPTSSQLKLERAKTERQRPHNILAEEAAQIFDDKIPVQQKNSYCQG